MMTSPIQQVSVHKHQNKSKNSNNAPSVRLCNFVKKLYYILTEAQCEHSIRWTQNGLGFQIINQEQFTRNILSKYYRHSNIPSFIRQLNMYGFRKIKDVQRHYYMHPLFIRHQPELIPRISRKPQKKLLIQNPNDENKQPSEIQLKKISEEKITRSKRKQKKVRFLQSLFDDPQNQNQFFQKPDRKQIKSFYSVASHPSLANLINKSSTTIFYNSDFDDLASICENLQEREQKNERYSIKSRKIFWTPSEIISEDQI